MSKFVWAQADEIKCHIHTTPGCHMCHKIVTEMSQDCPAVSRDVADVSPDVTEMSRPSHISVCHTLSQAVDNNCHTSHAVSQSVNISVDV